MKGSQEPFAVGILSSIVSSLANRLKTGNTVCVIGAGTMGSGIAAHLANLGFNVTLLDLTTQSVHACFDRAKAAKPPHFFVRGTADKIRLGSIEENLDWVKGADWVCEAIIEKLDAKRSLYEKLEKLIDEDALISTNTSGLEISLLAEDRSESFKSRFFGTHFFNPPRYLKLLELIDTPHNTQEDHDAVATFLEKRVARRVVPALDTPGFIANRYGMWSMYHAIHIAEKLQLSVEQVDLITGPFLGRPRSGSFRLNDIVGLDIMQDIARNQFARCSEDPYTGTLTNPKSMDYLLSQGNIGNKAGKGYYDKIGNDLLSFDLITHAYRQRIEPNLPTVTDNLRKPLAERLRIGLEARDEVGEFMRLYLLPTLRYADYLKGSICHAVQDFDRVMQWGFGWEAGPFEMIDMIGSQAVLGEAKQFYSVEGQLSPNEAERSIILREPEYRPLSDYPVVASQGLVDVRDLGDGVRSIELRTKMGSVPPQGVEDLHAFLDKEPDGRFVLASSTKVFSVGFDLKFFLDAIDREDWLGIETALERLQSLGEKLSQRRVVAALHGYALGGGLELAMSCPQVIALSDAQIGLPEARVGLIPGGRGVTMMRQRCQDGPQMMRDTIGLMTSGFVATNAVEARLNGFLRDQDKVTFHPDMLITRARELALTVEPVGSPEWKEMPPFTAGMVDERLKDPAFTPYDVFIGEQLKHCMVKAASYDECLQLERERFLLLCQRPETKARIAQMLETGKPLRN